MERVVPNASQKCLQGVTGTMSIQNWPGKEKAINRHRQTPYRAF
jgi:hypothetical protein